MIVHDTRVSNPPRRRSWSSTLGLGLFRGCLALGLLALGALGAVLVLRSERQTPQHRAGASSAPTAVEAPAMSAPTAGLATEPAGDVEVILSPEAVAQAGIKTAEVTIVDASTSVQVPGTVMAN